MNCLGGSSLHQMLFLGLENSGKTTLLYRLRIPQWKKITSDIAKQVNGTDAQGNLKDPNYHYEEFTKNRGFRYGIWDVGGCPSIRRIWPSFYRYIKMSCLVFVVDGSENNPDRIAEARDEIHFLLNEDELRNAGFAVVINNKEGAYNVEDNPLKYQLKLNNLHPSIDIRVKMFIMDVAKVDGEGNAAWREVVDFARKQVIAHGGLAS